jgi:hypothetical protein
MQLQSCRKGVDNACGSYHRGELRSSSNFRKLFVTRPASSGLFIPSGRNVDVALPLANANRKALLLAAFH